MSGERPAQPLRSLIMSISRLVLGGLLALGMVGLSADAAQAQNYHRGGYNHGYGGRSYHPQSAYYSPHRVYASPTYYSAYSSPYYGQNYYSPSYYNSGYGSNSYRYGGYPQQGFSFNFGYNNFRR